MRKLMLAVAATTVMLIPVFEPWTSRPRSWEEPQRSRLQQLTSADLSRAPPAEDGVVGAVPAIRGLRALSVLVPSLLVKNWLGGVHSAFTFEAAPRVARQDSASIGELRRLLAVCCARPSPAQRALDRKTPPLCIASP